MKMPLQVLAGGGQIRPGMTMIRTPIQQTGPMGKTILRTPVVVQQGNILLKFSRHTTPKICMIPCLCMGGALPLTKLLRAEKRSTVSTWVLPAS